MFLCFFLLSTSQHARGCCSPPHDNFFFLLMTTSSCFLIVFVSLLLSFKHFTICQPRLVCWLCLLALCWAHCWCVLGPILEILSLCTGLTDSVQGALYWTYWFSQLEPLLGRLILCTGPSTGPMILCTGGPWDFTPLFSWCLASGACGAGPAPWHICCL